MKTKFQNFIYNLVQKVYTQLGPGHAEAVYQKAFHYELSSQGIMSEMEKHMDVVYTDSRGNTHNLTSDRIDIYIHRDLTSVWEELQNTSIFVELKAVSKNMNDIEKEQVHKYMRELMKKGICVPYGLLINFPQPNRTNLENGVDFYIMENPYKIMQ